MCDRRVPRDCCTPPVHTETVRVPHHIYTQHQQPIVNRWLEHDIAFNEYPVTQEQQAVAHPVIDRCVQRARPCAPACPRPCCARRPACSRPCCGGRRRGGCGDGYGYWY